MTDSGCCLTKPIIGYNFQLQISQAKPSSNADEREQFNFIQTFHELVI